MEIYQKKGQYLLLRLLFPIISQFDEFRNTTAIKGGDRQTSRQGLKRTLLGQADWSERKMSYWQSVFNRSSFVFSLEENVSRGFEETGQIVGI